MASRVSSTSRTPRDPDRVAAGPSRRRPRRLPGHRAHQFAAHRCRAPRPSCRDDRVGVSFSAAAGQSNDRPAAAISPPHSAIRPARRSPRRSPSRGRRLLGIEQLPMGFRPRRRRRPVGHPIAARLSPTSTRRIDRELPRRLRPLGSMTRPGRVALRAARAASRAPRGSALAGRLREWLRSVRQAPLDFASPTGSREARSRASHGSRERSSRP